MAATIRLPGFVRADQVDAAAEMVLAAASKMGLSWRRDAIRRRAKVLAYMLHLIELRPANPAGPLHGPQRESGYLKASTWTIAASLGMPQAAVSRLINDLVRLQLLNVDQHDRRALRRGLGLTTFTRGPAAGGEA